MRADAQPSECHAGRNRTPCARLTPPSQPFPMEPRGVEPLCRNALTKASTRVVNSLISDLLRLLTACARPMHTKCRGKPHARVSPPVRCFLDDTPSGVKRHPCSLIRLRVRTAYWQTSFCILFTWPACSTARHQCLESSGRYRYGPVQLIGLRFSSVASGRPTSPL